jgi:hypothetical protein
MERGLPTLARFVERAASEPDLWGRLLADPLGTARAEGVAVDARDVKSWFGIAGATDHELLAVIAAHLRLLDPTSARALLDACTEYLFPHGLPPEPPRRRPTRSTGLPLGARPAAGLTSAQLAALDCLDRFDLGPVQDYLAAESMLPAVWIDDATLEFRRYLGMRRVFARSFAMFSEQVDEVWHACLLFTELYEALCQPVFGELAHHDPWDEPKPEQIAALWEQFHTAYSQLYGELSYLWTLRLPAGTALPGASGDAAAPTSSGATCG